MIVSVKAIIKDALFAASSNDLRKMLRVSIFVAKVKISCSFVRLFLNASINNWRWKSFFRTDSVHWIIQSANLYRKTNSVSISIVSLRLTVNRSRSTLCFRSNRCNSRIPTEDFRCFFSNREIKIRSIRIDQRKMFYRSWKRWKSKFKAGCASFMMNWKTNRNRENQSFSFVRPTLLLSDFSK